MTKPLTVILTDNRQEIFAMANDRIFGATGFDRLLTQGRSDLHSLDVYPAAISAWTTLIEDLHFRSMKGETSLNGICWQHSQALITISGQIVKTVSQRQWDRASDHQRGMIEQVVITGDGRGATMIVTALRRLRYPDDVEIYLNATSPEEPLHFYDHLGTRHQ